MKLFISLLFFIFALQIQGSLFEIDKIQDKTELFTIGELASSGRIRQNMFSIGLPDYKSIIIYKATDGTTIIAQYQFGVQSWQQTVTSRTDFIDVSACQVNDDIMVIYNTSGSFGQDIYAKIFDQTGTDVGGGEITIAAGVGSSRTFGVCEYFNSNMVGLVYISTENGDGYDVKYDTMRLDTKALTGAITVNSYTDAEQYFVQLKVLKDQNSDIAVLMWNGKGAQTPNSHGIYYAKINIQTSQITENDIFISGYNDGKDYRHKLYVLDDGGFAIMVTNETDGSLQYVRYNKDFQLSCKSSPITDLTDILSESVFYKEKVHVITSTKAGKYTGNMLSIQNCGILEENIPIADHLGGKNQQMMRLSIGPESAVLQVYLQEGNPVKVYYYEYLAYQISVCSDARCAGCYNSQNCPVCTGEEVYDRVDRTISPGVCTCQDGFYDNSPADKNCVACSLQCATCNQQEECLTCKNPEMLLPSCLFPSKGFIQTVVSGQIVYLPCSNKCVDCEVSVDNCTACDGLNRTNDASCSCLEGFYDLKGALKSCLQCPILCQSCVSNSQCLSCKEGLNRKLNNFNGKCECQRGFKENEEGECIKCYQISEGCTDSCPKNSLQNEVTQVCEPLEYKLVSNFGLIVVYGVLISIFQLVLCLGIYTQLNRRYKQFQQEFHERQMEIKQQRQYIYKDLSENNSEHNIHSLVNVNNEKQTVSGVGGIKRNRRQKQIGNNNINESVNQSDHNLISNQYNDFDKKLSLKGDNSISVIDN